jgi:hypothetical protein
MGRDPAAFLEFGNMFSTSWRWRYKALSSAIGTLWLFKGGTQDVMSLSAWASRNQLLS